MRSVLTRARRFGSRLLNRDKVDVRSAMLRGSVAERMIAGRKVRWLITNAGDEIQSKQLRDGFYEIAELQQLAEDIGNVRAVLDVGANIGNHSVFFAAIMGAKSITMIEPFPPATEHLLANLALNAGEFDEVAIHRCALGAGTGTIGLVPPTDFNIGLTRIETGTSANDSVGLTSGDALGLERVDLVKIDVEGGELDVLLGLEATLRRCGPAIYIETSDLMKDQIERYLAGLSYELVRATEAYGNQFNMTFRRLPV
jgi:FkbM family methyltransferase